MGKFFFWGREERTDCSREAGLLCDEQSAIYPQHHCRQVWVMHHESMNTPRASTPSLECWEAVRHGKKGGCRKSLLLQRRKGLVMLRHPLTTHPSRKSI